MRKKVIRAFTVFAIILLTGCEPLKRETVTQSAASVETAAAATVTTTATTEQTKPVTEGTTEAITINEPKSPEYIEYFENDTVKNIYLYIPEESLAEMKAAPEREEYLEADITVDGEKYQSVGIRTKGNSSLTIAIGSGTGKYPFHIKFDKYIKGQSFMGLDELVLNNSTDDPSYLREYFGYEAFRAVGLDAPLTSFCNVYLNDELYGFYTGVECVDSSYLDRCFGGHDSSLYKARVGATLKTDMDLELMSGKKSAPADKADLKRLISVINETKTGGKGELEAVLDVTSVLKYFAVCAALHNWDDYCGYFAQNYYFYKNSDGRFVLIPWDMNESFLQTQAYYNESDGSRQDIATPITGWTSLANRPMAEKLLSVPEYYDLYLEYCGLLGEWLDELSSGELERVRAIIDDSAQNDPRSLYGKWLYAAEFSAENRSGISCFISERAAYISERLPQLLKN